jgi:hypothetical protein
MKTCFLLVFVIFSFLPANSSPVTIDTTSNPVVFFEVMLGHSYGRAGGLSWGLNANCQIKKILLSGRFTETSKLRMGFMSPFIPIPYFELKSNMKEFAILFGRRFTKENRSYSFSIGISQNQYMVLEKDANDQSFKKRSRFYGVPFEANLKLFYTEKRRFKIFGIIPTGSRPIAFGRSVGFKLFANFSEHSFVGLGLTLGMGTHKQY